jgi:Protein of unknown function (DUF3102)
MLAKQLSTQEVRRFDYNSVSDKIRVVVQQQTIEIKRLVKRTAQDNIDIGKRLSEVKQQLGHGKFKAWLEAEFNWREWTARKFMQVARKFKSVNFTDLSVSTSALYLLSSSSTPEHACKEVLERATQGEDISFTKAKNIIAKHQETVESVESSVSKAPERIVEVLDERQISDLSYSPTTPNSTLHTLELESIAELSEDKLPKKQESLPLASKLSHEAVHDAEKNDDLLDDQIKGQTESPFLVGDLMYLDGQEPKLLGRVAEIKGKTANEIIIKILLH